MTKSRYTHKGKDDITYPFLPACAKVEISGSGNVTIAGDVGKGAEITKSGTGKLHITGNVDEDVVFKISGIGDVSFANRPPNSVLLKIIASGMGKITMPGGYFQRRNKDGSVTHFSGNSAYFFNGHLIIDGIPTTDDDPHIIRDDKLSSNK